MRISDWSSDVCSSDLIAVVPHAFADHHRYVAEDLRFGSDLPVLMTEKDAVKCQVFATDRHYSVPIRAELPEAFWVALLDRLAAWGKPSRSEEHTSELQSLMRISYAVFFLKNKKSKITPSYRAERICSRMTIHETY